MPLNNMTPEEYAAYRAPRNEANRRSREKLKDKINERIRARYAENVDAEREKARAKYAVNKDAHSAKNRRSYLKHKDKRDAKIREWKAGNPEKLMLARVRKRAQEKGLPFDLTLADITIPEYCPALGLKLTHQNGSGAHPLPSSASMDRVIPALGYVRGNIVIVSNLANMIKSAATVDQLEAVARFYRALSETLN